MGFGTIKGCTAKPVQMGRRSSAASPNKTKQYHYSKNNVALKRDI